MAEATQTQEQIEQTLNKTDFGHLIYENRKLFLGLLLAILVGVTGYLLWKQNQASSAMKDSEEVFKFQSSTWADAKAGKVAPDALLASFKSLPAEVRSAPVMLPLALEMGEHLYQKGAYAEADAILSEASQSKDVMSQFFVGMQRVVVLEKLGKADDAIAILENLDKNKDLPLQQKVWLDLGRLYKEKGDKARAQSQFQKIVEKFPNDDYARVAKLYLSQLAAQ